MLPSVMKTHPIATIASLIALTLATSTLPLQAQSFCDLIREGKLDDASRMTQDAQAKEDVAWQQKLLLGLRERDAGRSVGTLVEMQNLAGGCADVIYNRIAGYYLMLGQLGMDRMGAADLSLTDPSMKRYDAFTRRLLLTSRNLTDEKMITTEYDQLAKLTGKEDSLWLMLDKGNLLVDAGNKKEGMKLLKAVAQGKSGEQIPAALYSEIKLAIGDGKTDEALRLLGILQEAYPNAVGLDALVAQVSDMSRGSDKLEREADRYTGTTYSVQVGVFSTKENAKQMADALASYKQKIDILPKKISGKNYFVVYVGRFEQYDKARELELTLEQARRESYQVIAR